MPYEKYKRFWAVTDAAGQLVCLTVYRKGAQEVLRRLGAVEGPAALGAAEPAPKVARPGTRSHARKTPDRLETERQIETGRQVKTTRREQRRRGE